LVGGEEGEKQEGIEMEKRKGKKGIEQSCCRGKEIRRQR
jgi:hypothetical protein